MSARSIIDVIGKADAFRLMGEAIAEAAQKNKEAGVTTASHIDGWTVITPGTRDSADRKKPRHSKPRAPGRNRRPPSGRARRSDKR